MYLLSCGAEIVCHSVTTSQETSRFQTGTQKGQTQKGQESKIIDFSWSVNGHECLIVPESEYAEVAIFDNSAKQFELQKKLHNIRSATCCAFMKTHPQNFGVGTQDGEVHIWNAKRNQAKVILPHSKSPVFCMDFFMFDAHFAIGNRQGAIAIFNEKCGLEKIFTMPDPHSLSNICCHPVRRGYLGATSENGDVIVWDIKYFNSKDCQFYVKLAHAASCTDMTFSRVNQRLLASVGFDKIISCYDMAKDDSVLTIMAEEPLLSVDLHIDGKTLATGDVLGGISIYDLRTPRQPLHSWHQVHVQPVRKVSFWSSPQYIQESFIPENMKNEMFADNNECPGIWHSLGTVDENMNPQFFPNSRFIKGYTNKEPTQPSKSDSYSRMPKTIKEMQEILTSHIAENDYYLSNQRVDDEFDVVSGLSVSRLIRSLALRTPQKPNTNKNVTLSNTEEINPSDVTHTDTPSNRDSTMKIQCGIPVEVSSDEQSKLSENEKVTDNNSNSNFNSPRDSEYEECNKNEESAFAISSTIQDFARWATSIVGHWINFVKTENANMSL